MKQLDRVRVTVPWSTFKGREGTIVGETDTRVLVLLDGEKQPLPFPRNGLEAAC